jgi:hypothetical protein
MGEAGAAGRGGYFGLAFGGFGAPTIPVMTPIRSALTSRKFGASTSGWRGGVLSVTQYPARSVGHPGFGSSSVSSIVSPSGPVTMTKKPSPRSVLANHKASLRVSFSALNDPDTPSVRIARTRYPIPAFPKPRPHDHYDSANAAV